eukprot:gnl/Spiro4/14105_TR7577_c0_g1_i1.p1 gnl/Spiro4/14105_TR7577_c0_g1~~gnl/Spiro4/14105_TR7577_c0_g1_i1.p1  ORF type:complete len:186 (-),score=39.30 gnl/Spiro4/14105_TR7577_c0_g1_i1:639-1118(-)
MGMMHPTSRKWGHEMYSLGSKSRESSVAVTASDELLGEMMQFENRLRLSRRYQEEYSAKNNLGHFEIVTEKLQKEVLENFPQFQGQLPDYWDATARHGLYDDAVWIKYDRSQKGSLQAGSPLSSRHTDIQVFDLNQQPIAFGGFLGGHRPLVLVGSSIS